jgi:hypothetical protein
MPVDQIAWSLNHFVGTLKSVCTDKKHQRLGIAIVGGTERSSSF